MKILIAISSKTYSVETLRVGMKVGKAFNASTTIVDVGAKINQFSMKEVDMVQERMDSWDIDRPGVDVLEWAFEYLAENNFIEKNDIDLAITTFKPPIFWKDKPILVEQSNKWNKSKINTALKKTFEVELQISMGIDIIPINKIRYVFRYTRHMIFQSS